MMDLFNTLEQMALDGAERPSDESQAHSEELRLGVTSFTGIHDAVLSIRVRKARYMDIAEGDYL